MVIFSAFEGGVCVTLDRLIAGFSPLLSWSLLPVASVAMGTDEMDSEDWGALNGDTCIGEVTVNEFKSFQMFLTSKNL